MSPSTTISRSTPSTVTTARARSVSPPLSEPASSSSRTASSISLCEVTPSFFRKRRTDRLKASSSMTATLPVRDHTPQRRHHERALGRGEARLHVPGSGRGRNRSAEPVAPSNPSRPGREPVQDTGAGARVHGVVHDQRRAVEIAVAPEAPHRAAGPHGTGDQRVREREPVPDAEAIREEAEPAVEGGGRGGREPSEHGAAPGVVDVPGLAAVALATEPRACAERRRLPAAPVAWTHVGPHHRAVAPAQPVDVLACEGQPHVVAG